MLDRLRARRESEQGFTLIELMVVVLIIAILVAIAIPTFLGARDKANDRAAQSDLRNTLTAQKAYFADKQAYAAYNDADLVASEPSIAFVNVGANALAKDNKVIVILATSTGGTTNDTVILGSRSSGGTCFWLRDVAKSGGGTGYQKVSGACTDTAPTGTWATSTSAGW